MPTRGILKQTYCNQASKDPEDPTQGISENESSDSRLARKPKAGPIKIIIVDKKSGQIKTVCWSIFAGITQFLLGATNCMVWWYVIQSGDYHALFGTLGWHFFCVEAIIALSFPNGWQSPLRLRDRRIVHLMFQVVGFIISILGSAIILTKHADKFGDLSAHGIAGIVAISLTIITVLVGPTALQKNPSTKMFHISLGVPTFVSSSICLILGIVTTPFQKYTGKTMSYLLVGFICYYTLFIVVATIRKYTTRRNYVNN